MHTITVAKIPSVNHYVKHAKGRHFKSKEVTEFEKAVKAQLEPKALGDITELSITFVLRKDFGRRDLDNMPKVFIDCLSDVFGFNDAKIEKLMLEKKLDKTLNHELIIWEALNHNCKPRARLGGLK